MLTRWRAVTAAIARRRVGASMKTSRPVLRHAARHLSLSPVGGLHDDPSTGGGVQSLARSPAYCRSV